MRNPIILIIAVAIIALFLMPTGSDGATRPENEPTEPAILCYYTGGMPNIVTTFYVCPNEAIGTANIPEPTGAIHYWVRMDTGEVVTSSSAFAPGMYMIKGYTIPPTPWGNDPPQPEPEPETPSQDNTLAIIAIILSAVAIIASGAVLLMNRRK